MQVACPSAFTVTAPQLASVLPLAVKFTFPTGRTGVKGTPASCAVKVTVSPTMVELEGDAGMPSVGVAAVTV